MPENLAQLATRGAAWSVAASGASMAASLICQLVLGWLLSKRDFGVYALAMAFCDLLGSFRDGGISLWLMRLTPMTFTTQVGAAYYLALLASVLTAIMLCGISFFAGWLYADPQVTTLMLIVAATFPLTAYPVVAATEMQVHLRIRGLVTIRLLSALLRYGLAIAFAWAGWGALSFVLPLTVVVLAENLMYFAATRLSPWRKSISWHSIRELFAQARQTLWGTLAAVLFRQTDYIVLGLVASKEIVGTYFFAFQLTNQFVILFGESLRKVVLPVFARVEGDPDRTQRGLYQSALALGFFAAPWFCLVAVVAEPFESLLWHGRWQAAVPAITLLAMAMPLHLSAYFTSMVAQAHARFDLWTLAAFVRGAGFGVAVAVAWQLGWTNDATSVALVIAFYIVMSGLGETWWLLQSIPLQPQTFVGNLLPIIAVEMALATLLLRFPLPAAWSSWLQIGGLTGTYVVLYMLCLPSLFPRQFPQAMRILRTMGRSS